MMMKVLILVCSSSLTPRDCTAQTAIDVIRAPDASNEVACAMQSQAYLAQTSLASLDGQTYMKIVCKRDVPARAAAAQAWSHWGLPRSPRGE